MSALVAWAEAERLNPEGPKLVATITPICSELLLGESLALEARVMNTGTEPVKGFRIERGALNHLVKVLISEDRKTFYVCDATIGSSTRVEKLAVLEPSHEWSFRANVLWRGRDRKQLAFPRPGRYFVKLRYPLSFIQRAGPPLAIESESIEIRVKPLVGTDEEVWQQINDEAMLGLLQTGSGQVTTARAVARVLERFPKSSYGPWLRRTLLRYYFRHRSQLGHDDKGRLREVLGVYDPTEELTNERLNKDVRFKGTKHTIGELVAALAEESGLVLDAAVDLRQTRLNLEAAAPNPNDVRGWMEWLRQQVNGYWTFRGKGFLLTRTDRP